ncbi:septation protein SepH [Bifidobacterium myosotis]|uniref:DUF3071 domain-containing protein n=1 Tax=Bifidobacterium myosotis TaxID=1630166 RepID=A0A5M9ZJM9_9BIFI|nr:septation protein SepH [Bifidobacterium myosotis]KAA8827827.1 DUF3071 domain-containing protein [Bifidobacterium myosotis]
MAEERLEKAGFVRVSESGDLVFSTGGRQFAVSVDDTLERAILEAKQIKSETQRMPQPHQQSTLPISQIQSLIRAGADPARVAERYHLSETLVRRFSAAVETEKQYAIEQFLTVPAPKDSRVRTISELVERTLASVSIGMESVTWKSTRRGLEPWRIVAIFNSAGREIHAEWTWNMHDNSVVCLNNAARKLLGEQHPGSHAADSGLKIDRADLPGDSVRSARIERAVSAWAAPAGSSTATGASGVLSGTPTGSMPPIDLPTTGSIPAVNPLSNATAAGSASVGSTAATSSASGTVSTPATSSGLPSTNQTANGASATTSITVPGTAIASDAPDQEAEAVSKAKPDAPARPAKRRSGRSAVPSWDEILFGE